VILRNPLLPLQGLGWLLTHPRCWWLVGAPTVALLLWMIGLLSQARPLYAWIHSQLHPLLEGSWPHVIRCAFPTALTWVIALLALTIAGWLTIKALGGPLLDTLARRVEDAAGITWPEEPTTAAQLAGRTLRDLMGAALTTLTYLSLLLLVLLPVVRLGIGDADIEIRWLIAQQHDK